MPKPNPYEKYRDNPYSKYKEEGSISTVTNEPVQTGEEKIEQSSEAAKKIAAGAVRYGVPTAAGLATGGASLVPGLLTNAAATAVSEFSARQIERIGTDPKLDDLYNDLKASATAGAIDIGVGSSLALLGRGITSVSRKLILPREMPPDVELAHTILGRQTETGKKSLKFWKAFKKGDPFSLTPGQLNRDEKGFVTFLEGIARGGSGAGIMTEFDNRNINHVTKALGKYFDSVSAQRSGPEMGAFFRRLFGFVDDSADAFKPVEAYRAYLYRKFEDELVKYSDDVIDGTKLREFFQKSIDPDLLKIYSQMRSTDLVPPLKSESDKAWKSLSPEQMEGILKTINSFVDPMDDKFTKRIDFVRKQILPEYEKFLRGKPELNNLRKTANSFYGAKEDALYNATMRATKKALYEKPSSVITMFNPLRGDAAVKYDQLMQLKRGLYFSAATPPSAIPGRMIGNTAQGVEFTKGMGHTSAIKLYEESILQPLRFRFVDAATDTNGVLNGGKLLKQFERIEAEAPEMLKEIWGSEKAVKHVRDFASTLQTLTASSPEKSIFIQLKTAAAMGTLGGLGGGLWSYFQGDSPTQGAAIGGAASVLIAPRMLAKVFANPTLTRALTDGISKSTQLRGITPALAMTFRKMATMYPVSKMYRDESPDAQQFYSFSTSE
jgi:hypothetical protein